MAWSIFRRRRDEPSHDAWWQHAERVAAQPSVDALTTLRAAMVDPASAPDEADRQQELVEGIERLIELRGMSALSDLPTQHRVIGGDRCHYIAPVSIAGPAAVSGKLFLTSERAIFTGASVVTWPWHRVRSVGRQDRDVVLMILGAAEPFVVRCNTYAEAFEAEFIADRLSTGARRNGSPL